jgi:mono/diheme cytochrome c family protein
MKKIILSALSVIGLMIGLIFMDTGAYGNRGGETAAATERSAAQLYSKYCATCHGKDGRSKTLKAKRNHARNLTDSDWQTSVSDERIFNSINHGRGKMPSFTKKLTEAEIDSLATYVRGLKK